MGFWNLMWLVATLSSSNATQGLSAISPAPSPTTATLTQGLSPATTGTLSTVSGVSLGVVSPPAPR